MHDEIREVFRAQRPGVTARHWHLFLIAMGSPRWRLSGRRMA